MHELSIGEAIVDAVADRAAGRKVLAVSIRVGHFRQVVPEALTFAWEMLTATTDLDGAALQIEFVPAVAACGACGDRTTLDAPVLACASCGSRAVTLQSGDELLLVSVETTGESVMTQAGH
jgi:hydrogenase nickel incorporation protein HypA/HybF